MLTKDDLESLWSARNAELQDDRSVLRLQYTQGGMTKDGFEEVVLNEPKVLFDTAVGMLSSKPPLFVIPMKSNPEEEEKIRIGKAERFLSGVLHELDTKHFREGRGQWLRELAYWTCSGWVCCFPWIDTDGSFHADFYDPLTIYPLWVSGKLLQVMRKTEILAAEVKALAYQWGINLPPSIETAEANTPLELVNMWEHREDGVYNYLEVAGTLIKPETRERYDRIPILIGLVNGSPERDQSDWRKYVGQSVIAANKTMYEEQNRWVSMMMQIAAQAAFPTLTTETPSGEAILDKKDLGHSNVIPIRSGEKITPLDHVKSTPEISIINSILGGGIQRGGLPHVIYGGLPFELSGFALSQMISAVQYKLNPYITAMQQILSQMAISFLEQYSKWGKDIELSIKDKERNKFFLESFSKNDLPQIQHVDVVIDTGGHQDKIQQIVMAKAAMQEPALLSRETIWNMIVPDIVEDPSAEMKRIVDDETSQLPPVKMIKMVEKLRQQAEVLKQNKQTKEAAIVMGYAQLLIDTLAQGIQQQQQQSQQQGMGAGMRGGPEPSPEEMRAAMGQQPPGGGQMGMERGPYQTGGMA